MNSSARSHSNLVWLLTGGVGMLSFAVYLTTMCRSVSFVDAGELAAVAAVLGIAHPTGYPFYTVVSRVALTLNPGLEPVVALNAFSAVVVSSSVALFFRLLLVLAQLADGDRTAGRHSNGRSTTRALVAALVSLVVGFSTTVWAQSVAVEVYALHVLLTLLTLLSFLKSFETRHGEHEPILRYLVISAFLLGLSFTNHLTTLLILPSLALLYFRFSGIQRDSWLRLLKLFPFFVLGLTPYLFLPLRSLAHPPVAWGYPAEAERFLWHVSGTQYRSWMFSSFESAEKQLSYFVNNFSGEFNWLAIALIAFGVVRVFQVSKSVFWFLVVAFVSCVFYSINYEIHDIDSYFLLAYIVSGMFLFFGADSLTELVKDHRRQLRLMPALLVLPILQVNYNIGRVDESDNYLTEDYTHNVLNNAATDAVIFTYQWDYFVSPALYYQYVRNERRDVAIIDKELLRRSWYFIYLEKRFPWLIERSREAVEGFLAELQKFEHDLPYDARTIEARYVELINDFIRKSMVERPVYVGPEIEPEFGRGLVRIPQGLMFRLASSSDTLRIDSLNVRFRPASINSRLTKGIRTLSARMLTATGVEFLSKNNDFASRHCAEKALLIDPTYEPARALRDRLALRSGKGNH